MEKRATVRRAAAPGSGDMLWRQICRRYGRCAVEYRRSLATCRRRMSRHAVHELRVAIRRLLACVELMRAAGGRYPSVRRHLREQSSAIGTLRDTQVQLRMIKDGGLHARPPEPLVGYLRKRKKREAKAARKELGDDRAARRLALFTPGPAPGGGRPVMRLREFIERRLRRAAASLALLSSASGGGGGARHRARVQLRTFHFILEALGPAWHGDRDGRLSRSLSACQGMIGQIHDRELLLCRIGRLVSGGKLGAASVQELSERMESEKQGRLRACSPLVRRARARSHACF